MLTRVGPPASRFTHCPVVSTKLLSHAESGAVGPACGGAGQTGVYPPGEFIEGDNGSREEGNASSEEGSDGAGEEGKGSGGNDCGKAGNGSADVDGADSAEEAGASAKEGKTSGSTDSCACAARTAAKKSPATKAMMLAFVPGANGAERSMVKAKPGRMAARVEWRRKPVNEKF